MAPLGVAMFNRLRLSELGADRLSVCCDKCGLVSNRSVGALIGSYGDLPLNPLKQEMAQQCSFERRNELKSQCGVYFRVLLQETAA